MKPDEAARFSEMMYSLAQHFRVPAGDMTKEYIRDYWEGLNAYDLEDVANGFRSIKQNREQHWFPSIREITKATLSLISDKVLKLPTPTQPDKGVTPEQVRKNKINAEWFKLYFGLEIFDPDYTLERKVSQFAKRVTHFREITTQEKVRYAPYLKEEGDTGHDANRKREAYVNMRLSNG
jgi:hypothetical protein